MSKIKEADLIRIEPKYPNQELGFRVPIAPSVNHMYINTKTGARIPNKKAKDYEKTVKEIAKLEIEKQNWKMEEKGVWFYMDLYFYFPDRRKRDSHNCLKLLLDCLEGIVFYNDYFVMPRIQRVEMSSDEPYIDIIFSSVVE